MATPSDDSRAARVAGNYVGHLSAIESTHGVIAQEDIFNERGMLLVKKGMPIKPEVAERLRGHSLQKPVDELIALGRSLNANQVHEDTLELLQRYADLFEIHRRSGFADGLRHLFFVRAMPHVLLQHLTVLKERMPDEYQRTLFTAWFGALVADEMRMPSQEVYSAFIAALFHDIGLLHLDRKLLERPPASTREQEWLYGQHAVIAQNTVVRTGIYEAPVAQAVLQHHEVADGSGFPFGLAEDKLGPIGQVLALCEAMFFMRMNEFEQQGKNLADALPFLQVNAKAYFYPIYKSVYGILRRSGLRTHEASDLDGMHAQLLQGSNDLRMLLTELVGLSDCLAHEIDGKRAAPLLALTQRIMEVSRTSGLVDETTLGWLRSLRADEVPGCAEELNELSALHMELLWLIKRAHRKAREVINEQMVQKPELASTLAPSLQQLESDLKNTWTTLTPQLEYRDVSYR